MAGLISYQDFRDYISSGTNYFYLPREYEKLFRTFINRRYDFNPTTFESWINRLTEFKMALAELKGMKKAKITIRT